MRLRGQHCAGLEFSAQHETSTENGPYKKDVTCRAILNAHACIEILDWKAMKTFKRYTYTQPSLQKDPTLVSHQTLSGKNGKRERESTIDRLQFVVYIMFIRFYCHLMAVGILVVGKQCQKHKCQTSLYARDT